MNNEQIKASFTEGAEDRLSDIIKLYKEDFERIDEEERYKWTAIQQFQNNWDIEADDFKDMLEKSLAKAENLLTAAMFFAKGMILNMAELEPENVRGMFRNLYDEEQPLLERIKEFKDKAEEIKNRYSKWEGRNSYQTDFSATVYLFFRYPDKYYIFKSTKFRNAAKVLGYMDVPKRGTIESIQAYFKMVDWIWNHVKNDDELVQLNHNRLTEQEYGDPSNHVLAEDMIYFISGMAENVEKAKKNVIDYGRNILLYGVPGAGKSFTIQRDYCSDQKFIERVVFHPDYTYSDFVGQILPRVEDESLEYVFTPGPFTNILKKAKTDPDNMYFLIIEEINRGNAPAIFGEIFQLLDRKEEGKYPDDKVGESEYGITIFDVAKEVYGDEQHEIIIPRNLTILATMNTADQNVFTLDTAFQRRWEMKQIENNVLGAIHAEDYIEGNDITWGAFATTINELVLESGFGMASSEDKRLGAYFVKRKELQKKKFSEKVLKYLWDDVFKMDREQVFNPDILSMDKMLNIYMKTETNPLAAVIKKDVYVRMQNFDPESFAEPITKTTDNE